MADRDDGYLDRGSGDTEQALVSPVRSLGACSEFIRPIEFRRGLPLVWRSDV